MAKCALVFAAVLLVGCGDPKQEDAAAPAREHGAPGVTGVTVPAGEVAGIPAAPARGAVQGRPFAYEEASLNEGILKLRQGEDFFADAEVTLFLFLEEKDRLPEGRSWDVDCEGGWRGGVPHVHVAWRAPGEKMPTHESVTCGYRLRLELGEETAEGRMPGRIALRVPSLATEIAGTFEAEVEGLVRRGGEVDLTKDDLDVAHHLAALWLAERAGGEVEIVHKALGWLHVAKPEGRPQAGYSVYWWRPAAGGDEQVAKLQFEKRDGTWQVARALEPWQVSEAHSISPRGDLSASFDLRAARRFEEEHVARHGKAPVFVSAVRSSYNPQKGLAETTVRYALTGEEARRLSWSFGSESAGEEARYLFRTDAKHPEYDDPAAWHLDRRLAPGETVDFKQGVVHRGS